LPPFLDRIFPATARAALLLRSATSTGVARGVPGAGRTERGVCADWALLAALERRGLEDGLPVENATALRVSTIRPGGIGNCGMSRLLPRGPILGIECRRDAGDDPVGGFARRETGSADELAVVVDAVVAGLANAFSAFSLVLVDIFGCGPLRDACIFNACGFDADSLSPKLSLCSLNAIASDLPLPSPIELPPPELPPPETSLSRRERPCTLFAIPIYPYHD
jgi:hypothetical protein